MIWRLPAAALLAAVVALSASGCQEELTAGPALIGANPSTLCVPLKEGHRVVVAEVMEAPKSMALHISKVTVMNLKNAAIIDTYVVPVDASGALGSVDYPVDEKTFPTWS